MVSVLWALSTQIYIQLIGFIICDKSMFTHQTLDTCDKQEKKSHFDVQNKIWCNDITCSCSPRHQQQTTLCLLLIWRLPLHLNPLGVSKQQILTEGPCHRILYRRGADLCPLYSEIKRRDLLPHTNGPHKPCALWHAHVTSGNLSGKKLGAP